MNKLLSDILYGRKSDRKEYGFTIGIHAPARTGKTLTSIMFIISILLRWSHIKGVISNVALDFSSLDTDKPYIPLKNIKMIMDEEYQDYIIFTDEFRRYCDSRMSSSFKNKFISNLLADTGKQKQIHIFTDQDANSVDRRIRGNTDMIIHPFINLNTGLCTCKYFVGANPYHVYYSEHAYNRVAWWQHEFSYEAKPYYKYFDTEQKIDDYMLTFEPEEIANDFIEWIEGKKYDTIEDFKITQQVIDLWTETEGVHLTGKQTRALRAYIRYNTDFMMKGKQKK